jgi:hypothetical protein
MKHKNLIFLLLICIPFLVQTGDDNDKKEVQYQKQLIFFPIATQIPDILKESNFGGRYSSALKFRDKISGILTIAALESLPEEAKNFVQKGIDDFERYYAIGLNNPRKKLQLILGAPAFWVFVSINFFLAGVLSFFKKELLLNYYILGLLGSIIFLGFASFKLICPCQLGYFWERRVLQNRMYFGSCKEDFLWALKHPLQNACLREQILIAHKPQLQATFFTIMQLKQSVPTYTICPMAIFLNSFSSMGLEFEKRILIVSFFQEWLKPQYRERQIEQIKKLFSKKQEFVVVTCKSDVYPRPGAEGCLIGEKLVERPLGQTDQEYFHKVFSEIEYPLHGVLYCKDRLTFPAFFEEHLYQFAHEKNAHLIHFDCSNNPDHVSGSVFKNHSLFDQPINKVPLPG